MKALLKTSLLVIVLSFFTSCSNDTINTDNLEALTNASNITARFINDSDKSVDFEVYNVNGDKVNTTLSVLPGSTINLSTLTKGEATFRIVTANTDIFEVMDIEDKNNYYIILNQESFISTLKESKI